jgi:sugar phosphate isomerase/epimerase
LIDQTEFIDFAVAQGVEGVELTSYYFPPNVGRDELLRVRRHAFLRGVTITGTSVGNTFTLPKGPARDTQLAEVKLWIDHAAVLGAPHVRVFAGNVPKNGNEPDAVRACIEALEECGDYAAARGVFLGIENHHGIVRTPEALLRIVQAVKSPAVGINLDSGNFHLEDPYAAFAQCAPFAVNVQMKEKIRRGEKAPLEDADLARFLGILRDANYSGWVVAEYETNQDPWLGIPRFIGNLRTALAATAGAATAAASAKETLLFDGKTLAGWKPTNFAGAGPVEVQDGVIVLGIGGDLTGITLASNPPKTNYEIEWKAQRMEGEDFFSALTFPVGETALTFVNGGWGGAVVGLSNINGMNASENETHRSMSFESRRWYRFRIRVTPQAVKVWCDNEMIVDLDIRGKTLELRFGEIELCLPLGFATWRTRGALKDIILRPLQG